jgi:hypothetical protein
MLTRSRACHSGLSAMAIAGLSPVLPGGSRPHLSPHEGHPRAGDGPVRVDVPVTLQRPQRSCRGLRATCSGDTTSDPRQCR